MVQPGGRTWSRSNAPTARLTVKPLAIAIGHDLAVLRMLGFTDHQLASTVAWQASAAAVIGVAAGVVIGVAAGRWLWILFARQVYAVPDATVPVLAIVLTALGTLVLANLIAVVPGRSAARTPAAVLLRSEQPTRRRRRPVPGTRKRRCQVTENFTVAVATLLISLWPAGATATTSGVKVRPFCFPRRTVQVELNGPLRPRKTTVWRAKTSFPRWTTHTTTVEPAAVEEESLPATRRRTWPPGSAVTWVRLRVTRCTALTRL